MPIITATFENADTAEWALRNLRDTGVTVNATRFNARRPHRATGLFPYVFSGSFSNLSTGGYAPDPFDDTDARRAYDIRNAEVTMQLDVSQQDVKRTEAYLISRHGSHVTRL